MGQLACNMIHLYVSPAVVYYMYLLKEHQACTHVTDILNMLGIHCDNIVYMYFTFAE